MARVGWDRSDKIAFTALLVLVWLAATWWTLQQPPYMTPIESTLFINRSALCLLIFGVFVAYYIWRTFKPAHWTLRDHDGYKYPSITELPNFWSQSMARYKRMVEERRRREA